MNTYRHFKHGPELREFWRLEKVKQKEKAQVRDAQARTKTPRTGNQPLLEVTPNNE